jgi:hypothetical protein
MKQLVWALVLGAGAFILYQAPNMAKVMEQHATNCAENPTASYDCGILSF